MRFFAGVVVTLAVLVAAGLVYIYAGAFDVSARHPHSAVGKWVLETTLEHSIAARAEAKAPAHFTPEQAREGFAEYDHVCSTCHGGPGMKAKAWTKGMRPAPPDLSKEAQEFSDAELFWIVKNGIKMSGMPAQAKDESDEEIWSAVAFLRTLPKTSAQDYARMKAAAPAEHTEG